MRHHSRPFFARWILFLLFGISISNTVWAQNPSSEKFTFLGNFQGHGYYLSKTQATWQEAKSESEQAGGHLVVISSAEENAFLTVAVNRYTRWVWIGLTDESQEGVWQWVTQEPGNFQSWGENEPNNMGNEDYASLDTNKSTWNDGRSSAEWQNYYVLELQDYGEIYRMSKNWQWTKNPSPEEKVKTAQGSPDRITTISSGSFWYHYGDSRVDFADSLVVGYDNGFERRWDN